MFKFFWGKGAQQSAERLKTQKNLFQFQKTVQHGFPSKPVSLAWDPILRLLCIGTKTGAIKIFGSPGVEYYGEIPKESVISNLYFIPGQGSVIVLCEDNSIHLWKIFDNSSNLKCIHSKSLEGQLKKISACWVESDGQKLLIGTENGNIYTLNLLSFEVTDSVVYLDVVMQNVAEDFKVNPGAIEAISEQPGNPDHILIGYSRGLIVLWNRKSLSATQTFVASQQLESASWHPLGTKFVTAHNDGSYIIWTLKTESEGSEKKDPLITSPYGPFPCKALSKILWSGNGEDAIDVMAFGGGMPRASYGDRFTVSVLNGGKQHVVFDLTSKVVDFCLISGTDTNITEALVVLAEEELIVVDLITPGWPSFSLPYLASLHSSAITSQTTISVTPQLYQKIKSLSPTLPSSTKISSRPWPINGGISDSPQNDPSSNVLLLLTGHEDGSVRFWDANTAAMNQIMKFSTSACFSSDELDSPPDEDDIESEDDEWPPFRKIGVFDPYSDDPRLAVKKLCLCPTTGLLAIAGTAGQIVVAELSDQTSEKELPVTFVNIVSDRDSFVWKGHDKLPVRKGSLSFKPGFQPSSILQLHPPAASTALTLNAEWSVLAVGTAHGLALYDTVHHRDIVAKCTLNANDMSGAGDQPMSRRKSFKKSLRESFRRLRKGRSQRPMVGAKPNTPPAIKSTESTVAGPSTAAEMRPVERQIEARTPDDGMGSMVRCLLMAKTFLVSQSSITTPTLWAGTNSGAIYVFNLSIPTGEKRSKETASTQLAKEIQLKHKAPIVGIDIIDSNCCSLSETFNHTGKTLGNGNAPHRVVISSEEQFKVFTLPNLRPYGKYKLTAYTGCQVRRVAVIPFISKSDASYKENCMVCLSNQGEFHILSLPDLRRQMNAQAIRKEDIHATSSVVLTNLGEAFYMLSSSELQRVALSARNCLQIKCRVPIPNNLKECEVSQSLHIAQMQIDVSSTPEHSVVSSSVVVEDCSYEKNNPQNEINNSTIVSVEPETSFGDMTLDSIKDHMATQDENRYAESKRDDSSEPKLDNCESPLKPNSNSALVKADVSSLNTQASLSTEASPLKVVEDLASQKRTDQNMLESSTSCALNIKIETEAVVPCAVLKEEKQET